MKLTKKSIGKFFAYKLNQLNYGSEEFFKVIDVLKGEKNTIIFAQYYCIDGYYHRWGDNTYLDQCGEYTELIGNPLLKTVTDLRQIAKREKKK